MSLAAPAVAVANPVPLVGHTAPLLPTPPSILGNPPVQSAIPAVSAATGITPTMAATALAAGSVPVPVGLVSHSSIHTSSTKTGRNS